MFRPKEQEIGEASIPAFIPALVPFAQHVANGVGADLLILIGPAPCADQTPSKAPPETVHLAVSEVAALDGMLHDAEVAPHACVITCPTTDAIDSSALERLRQLADKGATLLLGRSTGNESDLQDQLSAAHLRPSFVGSAPGEMSGTRHRFPIAVIDRFHPNDFVAPPADFKVTAIMCAFNEEDVIEHTIRHLISEGISVHLIDNWSTDATVDIARGYLPTGQVSIEHYPRSGRSATTRWRDLLRRIEDVASSLDTDWAMLHDADEIRRSPWPDVLMRDALYQVGRAGFNAVDFTLIEFWPVDNSPIGLLERDRTHFLFGHLPAHFMQVKAWTPQAGPAELESSGGHLATFTDRRIFPHKFLLKHYPVRSQAHGEKKVFAERNARWDPAEKAAGWHVHYNHLRPGMSMLRNREDLERFEDDDFNRRYLIERLSGLNLPRS